MGAERGSGGDGRGGGGAVVMGAEAMGAVPRVVVVTCPDWAVVAAGVEPGVPVAVLHANRVVAASPAARAEGVAAGQRRREAQGACPELVLVAHDPDRDARAYEPVLQALDDLTPRVELTRPGRVSFLARGPTRYHGGEVAVAERAAALVAGILGTRVGVAGTPGVGVADGRFAATLAAEQAVTTGAPVLVPPGGSAAFCAPHPVATLADALAEVPDSGGRRCVELLPRLGLHTLGQVAALPRADLVGRFGPEGAMAHRLASAGDADPPDAHEPPPELSVELELDPPVEMVEPLAFAARQLAARLHDELTGRGLACTRVAVVAESEHGERCERAWRAEGALTPAAIAERARWQLDGWLRSPRAPTAGISLVRLVPDQVVPYSGRQLGFWGGQTQADERAARGVARLSALCGADAVRVPEWSGGRGPDPVVLVPAEATDPAARAASVRPPADAAPWPGRLPDPAPAVVLVSPSPAEVRDRTGAPVTVTGRGAPSGAPSQLCLDGRRWVGIEAWAGPWLYDERWWDPATRRRRARFQVLTDDGVAHLLAVEDGRWWREATYD